MTSRHAMANDLDLFLYYGIDSRSIYMSIYYYELVSLWPIYHSVCTGIRTKIKYKCELVPLCAI